MESTSSTTNTGTVLALSDDLLYERAAVADSQADEILLLPEQDRVSKRLCVHRTDFPLYIEPRVDRLGHRAAGT
jgi:hypothetical protein